MSERGAHVEAVALWGAGLITKVVEVVPGQDYRVQVRAVDGMWWRVREGVTAAELFAWGGFGVPRE